MKCNYCGADIPDGSRFCRECGSKLSGEPEKTPEWTYEEKQPVYIKQKEEVVLNKRLKQPKSNLTQKSREKTSKWWVWVLALIAVAAIFPSKKSHITSSPPPSPTLTIPVPETTVSPDSAETTDMKWYEQEPVVLENLSFEEPTFRDGLGAFTYKIPESWKKRHDPGSMWTYYYPFKDTNKCLIQVQLDDIGADFSTMSEETYAVAWPLFVESFVEGMSKTGSVGNIEAVPCTVDGKKVTLLHGNVSIEERKASGDFYSALFFDHDKVLNISALMTDEEKNIDLEDFLKIVCTVDLSEELYNKDSVYPKTIETTYILTATEAPDAVFTSPASENGLGGNIYYVKGTVKDIFSTENNITHLNQVTFVVETAKGDVMFSDVYTSMIEYLETQAVELGNDYERLHEVCLEPGADYSVPAIGNNVRVIGYYVGFSEVYQMPSFYYGYPNWVQADVMANVDRNEEYYYVTVTPIPTLAPTPELTPKPVPTPTPTKKPEAVSYSTNDKSTVKNGDVGVYAYKSHGGTYDNYWIIDFDAGYVYNFQKGNGNTLCDRVKIDSGDLNSVVIITYHDGNDKWQYGLHFRWARQPDHLILQDNDGFEYDFYSTNLNDALNIRDTMKIIDY